MLANIMQGLDNTILNVAVAGQNGLMAGLCGGRRATNTVLIGRLQETDPPGP